MFIKGKALLLICASVMLCTMILSVMADNAFETIEEMKYAEVEDALAILRHLVGLSSTATVELHNFTGSGELEVEDALLVLRGLVGLSERAVLGVSRNPAEAERERWQRWTRESIESGAPFENDRVVVILSRSQSSEAGVIIPAPEVSVFNDFIAENGGENFNRLMFSTVSGGRTEGVGTVEFRHILTLWLNEPSRENVLAAVELLWDFKIVDGVQPEFIYGISHD
jgi:hypothetical protein